MKKLLALLLALVLVFSLVACSTKTDETTAETNETSAEGETAAEGETTAEGEVPTIKYMVHAAGENKADIEAALNARLDELEAGYHVSLITYSWDNYDQKLGLAARGAAAEEEIFDLATTASWLGPYATLVNDGTLLDITEVLDKHPDLKATLTDAQIKGATINGGLYGIPTSIDTAPTARDYFAWNVPQLESIGLTAEDVNDIDTIEELEPVLAKWKEANPDKYPMRGGDAWAFRRINLITTKEDGSAEVSNVYAEDWLKEKFEVIAKYKEAGYLHPDAGTDIATEAQKAEDQWLVFRAEGEAGSFATWTDAEKVQVKAVPVGDDNIIYSGMVQGKLASVYAHSQYADQAVDFVEKLTLDPTIANILYWGIEGKSYEVVDGKAQWIEGQTFWNPWQNQWPNRSALPSVSGVALDSPEMKEAIAKHTDGQISAADLGFQPSPELSEKIAQVSTAADAMKDIQNGRIEMLDGMLTKIKEAGVDEVVTELKAEFEAWQAEQ